MTDRSQAFSKKTGKGFGFLAACVLTSLLAMTCLSVLAANQDLEEIIQEKISERHPTDTPAWWQSLGPEAPKTMIALYEKAPGIYQRLRLVEALGWYQDPEALAFLKKLAESSTQDVIRNGSIRAIGNSAGASEVDFIGKFLDHEDPQTRVAAGQALRKIATPRANALLQKFYEKEQMPWVKDRVQETSPGVPRSRGPLLRMDTKSPVTLNPEFSGSWKGILVVPSQRDSSLLQIEAQAKTQIEGMTALKGELSFRLPSITPAPGVSSASPGGLRSVTLQLSQVSGKDVHVSGSLKSDVLKEWGAKAGSVHFEGELQERGDARLLKLESRELLLTVILRKQ